jgi:hypothetical protein
VTKLLWRKNLQEGIRPGEEEEIHFLHDVQWSMSVARHSLGDSSWNAVKLSDTYHHGPEDKENEDHLSYYSDQNDSGSQDADDEDFGQEEEDERASDSWDAILGGENMTRDCPKQLAVYFFRALDLQYRIINEEIESCLDYIRDIFKEVSSPFPPSNTPSRLCGYCCERHISSN